MVTILASTYKYIMVQKTLKKLSESLWKDSVTSPYINDDGAELRKTDPSFQILILKLSRLRLTTRSELPEKNVVEEFNGEKRNVEERERKRLTNKKAPNAPLTMRC